MHSTFDLHLAATYVCVCVCTQTCVVRRMGSGRYLQHGTFDAKSGEYEYIWRPDSQAEHMRV